MGCKNWQEQGSIYIAYAYDKMGMGCTFYLNRFLDFIQHGPREHLILLTIYTIKRESGGGGAGFCTSHIASWLSSSGVKKAGESSTGINKAVFSNSLSGSCVGLA